MDKGIQITVSEAEKALYAKLLSFNDQEREQITHLLTDLINGNISRESLQQRVVSEPINTMISALAGEEIKIADKVVSFGNGTQVGDVTIRDIAAGNIVTYHINIYYGHHLEDRDTTNTNKAAQRLQKQRHQILKKVQSFWVTGLLEGLVPEDLQIRLQLVGRQDMLPSKFLDQEQRLTFIMPQVLPLDKSISDIFTEHEGSLLILGEPGSGKTMLLMDLARDLINRARSDMFFPIPIVFNLSSWTKKHVTLRHWFINELDIKYGVPRKISEEWLHNNQILPLLDSLDAIPIDNRAICITEINDFHRETNSEVRVVVCCRRNDYQNLDVELSVDEILDIQPLSEEQVKSYLVKRGATLNGLQSLLEEDGSLRELAQTPLFLYILSRVYEYENSSVVNVSSINSPEERYRYLFEEYVKHVLLHGGNSHYKNKTIHYLYWLSQQMITHDQEDFLLEQLQPDWLPSHTARQQYVLVDRCIAGLLAGAVMSFGFYVVVLGYGLISKQSNGYYYHLSLDAITFGIIGLVVGVVFGGNDNDSTSTETINPIEPHQIFRKDNNKRWQGVWRSVYGSITGSAILALSGWSITGITSVAIVYGLIGVIMGLLTNEPGLMPRRIGTVEILTWSLKHTLRSIPAKASAGVILGFFIGWFFGAIDGTLSGLGHLYPSITGSIAGAILGILLCFLFGRDQSNIPDKKATPNQGIKRSFRNALWVANGGFVLGGVFGVLVASGPVTWLLLGIMGWVVYALVYGGYACLSHYALRFVLWLHNCIPWNYIDFLDYADKHILLRKTGGGYRFMHNLLRDHFPSEQSNATQNSTILNQKHHTTTRNTRLGAIQLLAILSSINIGWYLLQTSPILTRQDYDVIIDTRRDDYNGTVQYSKEIRVGDQISIKAIGIIQMSTYSFNVEPEGTDRGFLGLPLALWNIPKKIADFPRGALLCKITGEPFWRYCGSSLDFTASSNGFLEFMINETKISRHKGHFDIYITITKSK